MKLPILKQNSIFILFFIIVALLGIQKHNKAGIFNYHSQLWADRAGYYVYLPATFIYGFHTDEFPDDIDHKTGDGFTLNEANHKVFTKYTSGVALMFLPFFLLAHLIASIFGLEPNGFSQIYHDFTNIGAAFYLTIGFVFLKKFLDNYVKTWISFFTVFILFFSTNLFYYSVSDPFMSHVYSFSLFAVLLYLFKKIIKEKKASIFERIALAVVTALIILIRPLNILFIGFVFLIELKSFNEFITRLRFFLQAKIFIFFVIAFTIIFTPQFLYWHFLSGNFIYYSYENEGFINRLSPKILEVLFSTNNGLFTYTPIYLIVIISAFAVVFRKNLFGSLVLILFLILTYFCASWHAWHFGCSFGQRSYVEYSAFFIIPLAILLEHLFNIRKKILSYLIVVFFLSASYINIRLVYGYDTCFYGSTWDWKEFKNYFDRTKMFGFTSNSYTFFTSFDEDYEVKYYSSNNSVQDTVIAYSLPNISKIDSEHKHSAGFSGKLRTIGHRQINRVDIEFYTLSNNLDSINLVCSVDSADIIQIYNAVSLKTLADESKEWKKISYSFELQKEINRDFFLKIYIWNQSIRNEALIDNFKIKFDYSTSER
jgi:hypothetical protein